LLAELLVDGATPPNATVADGRRRFQQLAGSVMAKGPRTPRSSIRVPPLRRRRGGRPDAPGVVPEAFHAAMIRRTRNERGLNATSTHDSKRSEDVRSRLAVLTEIPSQWLLTVDRWRRAHAKFRGGCEVGEEIYLYETIVGAAVPGRSSTPAFRRRIVEHMEKAAREAKRQTSWANRTSPTSATCVGCHVDPSPKNVPFHRDLERVLATIDEPARANALGMTVLKIAAPGIPDIYQGAEAGFASLTDPTTGGRCRSTSLLERSDNRPPTGRARRQESTTAS